MGRGSTHLGLASPKNLAKRLHSTVNELNCICKGIREFDEVGIPKYYYQKERTDSKGKRRITDTPIGRFREINKNIKNLLHQLDFPPYIKGGIRGESHITNALFHKGRPLLIRIDIKDFFPSISQNRVYKMFIDEQYCSEPVASILTRLTTLRGAVPLGSPSSMAIATLSSLTLAERLYGFSQSCKVFFTQYVDDFLFSGPRSFRRRVNALVKIIHESGFQVNPDKIDIMSSDDEQVATGVKINHNRLDIPSTL
jgi:RNA-directed DNA polymerase